MNSAEVTPLFSTRRVNSLVAVHASSGEAEAGLSPVPERGWRSERKPTPGRAEWFIISPPDRDSRTSYTLRLSSLYPDRMLPVGCYALTADDELIPRSITGRGMITWVINDSTKIMFPKLDRKGRSPFVRFDVFQGPGVYDSFIVIADRMVDEAFSTVRVAGGAHASGGVEEQIRTLTGGKCFYAVNCGSRELTVADALADFDAYYEDDLLQDCVLIALGSTDLRGGTTIEEFRSGLSELVHRFLSRNKRVVLSTMPWHWSGEGSARYNSVIIDTAAQLVGSGVTLGPDFSKITDDSVDSVQRAWSLWVIRSLWDLGGFDALMARSGYELLRFKKWTETPGRVIGGVVTAFGTPSGQSADDQQRWNSFLRQYLLMLRATEIPAFAWTSGRGLSGYTQDKLAIHHNLASGLPIDRETNTATTYQKAFDRADSVGVNFSGPEIGSVERVSADEWPVVEDFEYLAARNILTIRLILGLEHMDPLLDGNLDPELLSDLQSTMTAAATVGVTLVLTIANPTHYRTVDGRNERLGGSVYNATSIRRFWIGMLRWLRSAPCSEVVSGIDILSEPSGIEVEELEDLATHVASGIRKSGEQRAVIVPAAVGSKIGRVAEEHDTPWQDGVYYGVSHFFDSTGDGEYRDSYDQENKLAMDQGYGVG